MKLLNDNGDKPISISLSWGAAAIILKALELAYRNTNRVEYADAFHEFHKLLRNSAWSNYLETGEW